MINIILIVLGCIFISTLIGFGVVISTNGESQKLENTGRDTKKISAQNVSSSASSNNICDSCDNRVNFFDAIQNCDEGAVKTLLKCGISPNIRSIDGTPALSYAVRCNALDIVKRLIRAGADVNAMDVQGNTPLFAVRNLQMFNILVNAGAVVTAVNKLNRTILFDIDDYELDIELIEHIVKAGCRANHLDNSGRNALFFVKNNDAFIQTLIKLGADPECVDSEGRTPVFYADSKRIALAFIHHNVELTRVDVRGNRIQILDSLSSELDDLKDSIPNVKKYLKLNHDLANAIISHKTAKLEELLKEGADPNYNMNRIVSFAGSNRSSMMKLAIQENSSLILRLLVKYGADKYKLIDQLSPLMMAAQNGMAESFDALVELGVNPNEDNTFSLAKVCSHYVSNRSSQYCRIIQKSIDLGIAVTKDVLNIALNSKDNELINCLLTSNAIGCSSTLLEAAVKSKNRSAWMLQIEKGASISYSSIVAAIELDYVEYIKFVIQKGINPDVLWLSSALESKSYECVHYLLNIGVIPQKKHFEIALKQNMLGILKHMFSKGYSGDDSLVEQACGMGSVDALKCLLGFGLKLSEPSLIKAIRNGNVECVDYIIRQGVQPDLNALALAIALNNVAMASLLMNNGVAPTEANLVDALKNSNPKMVELIVKHGVVPSDKHLRMAIDKRSDACVDVLTRVGVKSMNSESKNNGVAPTEADLVDALKNSNPKMIELIVKHGVVPSDKHLRMAIDNRSAACINALMRAGVKPDVTDLLECIDNESVECVRCLLKYGDFYSFDVSSALEYAEKYSESRAIKRLLRKFYEHGEC